MKKKYKLVVVTVTYKSTKDLPEFVNSFYKYNDLEDDARLILVDNSPIEYREVENLIKIYLDIDYISNPENSGFGAANNIGFDLYDSDYVLFINNDVEFLEPVFEKIISIHEIEPNLGCVGIHQKGGVPSYYRKMDAPKGIDESTFIDKYHFISGAFMFFKSSIFIDIDRFDPCLFMYCEEDDLSRRLTAKEYYTSYIPTLHFLHKVGNRKKVDESVWVNETQSFCYLCKKYGLTPKMYSKGSMRRVLKLILYFFIKFDFIETYKLIKIYNYKKKYIQNQSKVKH